MSSEHSATRPSAAQSPQRPTRRGSARASVLLRAILGLAVVVGCEEVLVNPIAVSRVDVRPTDSQLFVGETVRLTAELFDDEDARLSGRRIAWGTENPSVATVDSTGLVVAVGPGTTDITATAEGRSGSASVVVLRRPRIELDRGSVAFSAIQGSGNPAPVEVGISNGGDGSLTSLSRSITYDGTPGGWLEARLDSTATPTAMTLTAVTGSLPVGVYRATVTVADPGAANSPVSLDVTFQVEENLPTAPSGLQATSISASTIILGWSDNSDTETEVQIQRRAPGESSFSPLATLAADATGYQDGTVAPDGRYAYRVRACSPAGCSPFSNQITVTTPPNAPSGLTAQAVDTATIELSWTDNSTTEEEVRLERRTPGGTFLRIATPSADATSYTDTGLDPDTGYEYRVQACNSGGCSTFSAIASATTPAVPIPAAPSALTAATDTTGGSLAIDLDWTDNSSGETGFQVERRAPGETQFSLLATVPADSTAYADAAVAGDATYVYRVRACASGGCSPYTGEASATTPPTAPSGLTATAASDTRIDLTWADNSATEAQFRIERDAGSGFVQIATPNADATAYSDTGLTPSTAYTYRVRACNAGGCSVYSATATATTGSTPAPAAPSALAVTLAASTTRADLTWTDNSSNENDFRVERSVDGAAFADLTTLPANTTTYADEGLTADRSYTYRVEACGDGGCSAYSNEAGVVTPPVAASGLTATASAPDRVDLAWTDNSGTEAEFRIERDAGSGFVQIATVPTDSVAFSDTAVTPGAAWDYRVVACNAGGCAAASGTASATTPLVAPSSPSAAAVSPTAIDVAWTDNSDNETEFRIQRATGGGAFADVGTVPTDSTAYADTGLSAGITYTYRIRACNAVTCSAWSPEVSATTGSPPTAPTGLTATVVSAAQVDLAWTDNSTDETGFRIERAVGTGTFSELATVGTDVVVYSDDSTVEDTRYRYRVAACSGGACSAPSNEAAATTPPSAASGVAVSTVSSTELDVTWTDNSDTETSFRIEGRTGTNAFAEVGSVGADVTTYGDSGLDPATGYDYRVVACNAAGCAAPSAAASGTTADVAPAAPTGLSATTDTTGASVAIDLAWTDNSDNESLFQIERSTSGGAFAVIDSTAADATAYTDTGVMTDTEYAYRVRACNADACSPPSAEVDAFTPPVAPTADSVVAVSDTRLDVRWTDNSATEGSFRVERRTGTAAFAQVATMGPNVTLFSDDGLDPSTAYDYRIRACNAGGCSTYSGTISGTTAATPPPADPSGLTATLAGDQSSVALGWTDNSTDETGFRVQRSIDGGTFTVRTTVPANTVTFTDDDIAVDNLYAYRVEACNDAGCSGFTNEASVVTDPVPPTGLTATVISAGQVDLAWTDASDTETGFPIERSVDGGAFVVLDTAAAGATGFSDVTTAVDTEYAYRIQACNATGCSAFTGPAAATTPPSQVTGLTATAISDTEIDLAWSDNSATETGMRIQRRISGGYTDIDTVAANVTSYSDSGLTPETTYEYRIIACNDAGCADASTAASATTEPIPVPAAPTGLGATTIATTQIDLGWTDASDNEDEFQIERSTDGGATFSFLASVGPDATAYSDGTTTADNAYVYRVAACNVSGCSPFSNTASAVTQPAAASGLGATVVSATQIDLLWTDNSETEAEFRIERGTDGGTFVALDTVLADVTTYSDVSTGEDTNYAYRVQACNAGGCAVYSNQAAATTPPSAASGLTATAVSDTAIALTWTDASDTETGFEVWRGPAGGTLTLITTTAANATAYTDGGLEPNTAYDYEVLACNDAGCAAAATATATTQSIPAPSSLTAGYAAGQVDLAWTDNSGTETEFRIERSADGGAFAALATVLANVTTYADAAVAEDTDYAYRVAACNADGCSAFSGTATVTTPPSAASGLAAAAASDTAIDLSWVDNSGTETEFRIQRRPSGGTFVQVGTVGANVTTFGDGGLSPATTYEYQVLACNAAGCAAPSGIASATTEAIPAPSGLGATVVSASQIDLGWSDNSGTEARFDIQRSTDGGTTFAALASVGAGVTTYSDGTTSADTEYVYRVAACNVDGCSAFSGTVTATTPPLAATGLGATVVSAAQVDLGWTDNSETEAEFRIERSVDGGAFAALDTVLANVAAFSDVSTAEDTEYAYRVQACNAGGCAAYSNEAAATTPPSAASGVTATAASDTSITLSWADNSDTETGFQVRRGPSGGTLALVTTTAANATGYTDVGLAPNTTYDYEVLACNDAGCAAPATASGTTSDVPPAAPSGLTATTDTTGGTVAIDLAWTDASDNEDRFRIERRIGAGAFNAVDSVGAGVTVFSDGAVSTDTEYSYRVLSCNSAGCSTASNIAVAFTPPTAPTGLGATPASDTRIDLSWTDNSATETAFRIERRTGADPFAQVATVGGSVTTYADQSLTPSTTYDYRVRACNSGGCSPYSGTVSATTTTTPPPAAPSALVATLAGDQSSVDLSWTDNATDEEEFRIQRSVDGDTYTQRAVVGANTITFTDNDIAVDNLYTYRVEACSAAGCSAFSNEDSVVTQPVPATGLGATVVSASQVDLSWTDASDTEAEFRIERSVDGGAFAALGTVLAGVTTYSDLTTAEDTDYAYRVQACNATGCAAYSNEATATTPPSTATGLTATATSDTGIDLTWTDASSTETEFRIQRRISGGYTEIDTVPANTTGYSDTGLTPVTTYEYRVLACNAAGCADPSTAASATTDPIPAPTALAATVVSANQVDLSWTDNAGTETRYEVQRSVDGGAFADLATGLAANTTAYSDAAASGDTEYAYQVRACNATSCSAYSAAATATTPPAAPSGLGTTVVSASQVDLAWTDNAGTETEFRIERSTGGSAFVALATVPTADATGYSDTGTVQDTTYAYRVQACNAGGCSAFSNQATAVTPPRPASGLTATPASDTAVALAWADNSTTETGFQVWRGPSGGTPALITTTAANTTDYTDTGLDPSTAYDYEVLACNGSGCAPAATATATTEAIPAPSDLGATVQSASQVDLAWTDNSGTETRFDIQRSTDGGATFPALASVGADVTTYSDATTAADTDYLYRVAACNADGCSAFSSQAAATTPPTAATGLTATPTSDTEVTLAWTDASDTETGFQVWRGPSGGTLALITTTAADATGYDDSGLSPGTAYDYEVLACNASGCAPAATASATTDPIPAPTGLGANVVSASQVDLSWTDNSGSETRFDIERSTDGVSFTVISSEAQNATSYSDLSTAQDTEYTYRVAACNADGCSAYSNQVTAATPPSAPTGLNVTSVSATAVDLAWVDNAATETRYEVERSDNGGAFAALTDAAADATTYTDDTVAEDTDYAYRVRACNAAGCSAFSGQATTTTPPTAASGLTATTTSDSEIALSWVDNSSTETGFEVQRRTGTDAFALITTVAAGTTTYDDGGLTPSTTYDYRVLACNDAGCADPTAVVSATTDVIPAPTGLSTTVVSATQVDLNWSDNSTTEIEFQIERSTDGGTTFSLLATVTESITTYSDLTTAADATYLYRVAACDATTCSAFSATATATTPPTAATGLTATPTSDTEVALAWTDASDTETGFQVWRGPSGGTLALITTTAADATGYDDSGLSPGTAYDYEVLACNGSGCAPAATATATTLETPPAAPGTLTATAGSATSVDLAWTDVATETRYVVARSADAGVTWDTLDAALAANSTGYTDATTAEGTGYTYEVSACNTGGCTATTTTVSTPPVAASGLGAIADSDTQITVTWTDNSAVETEYRLEWRESGGTFAPISLGADVESHPHTGRTASTTYEYRVQACLDTVCSPYSAIASATTTAAP